MFVAASGLGVELINRRQGTPDETDEKNWNEKE
jgi:hypothetical protein